MELMNWQWEIEMLLRLVLAVLLSGIIGMEREALNKSAGFRTHILVGIGACLMMIISLSMPFIRMPGDFGATGSSSDPARIAAQVVSGIGFLGAGAIMSSSGKVRGLTTAASLWAVAGIGLCDKRLYKNAAQHADRRRPSRRTDRFLEESGSPFRHSQAHLHGGRAATVPLGTQRPVRSAPNRRADRSPRRRTSFGIVRPDFGNRGVCGGPRYCHSGRRSRRFPAAAHARRIAPDRPQYAANRTNASGLRRGIAPSCL